MLRSRNDDVTGPLRSNVEERRVREKDGMTERYMYGRPIPEAIAGAVMGFQVTLAIAFVKPMAYLVEDMAVAPFVLGAGALLGAIVSWFIATRALRHMRLERGEVAERAITRRAA
jgi:hypothetical protein